MSAGVRFKSAWMDPEHVRLASFRSPDDGTKVALRGAVPPFLDPWLTGTGELAPELSEAARAGFTRGDDYAAFRCRCRHLVYACQEPGDPCMVCDCSEHRASS